MESEEIVVDQLYVVSDLHLGGEAPFQIFREGPALASLIDGLRHPAPNPTASIGHRRALVINGDFVDFLAERDSRHFDPRGAVKKLERIAADAAFLPVFDALRRFIAVPDHRLAIVLGNHDVELALPWVRNALQALLCAGDEAKAGRIVWSLDGLGVLLRIGTPEGPRVMCVHGNEVDAWNVVEHEALRRMGRDGLRDQRLNVEYVPNAGSRMVIEVMNDIKKRYPFVDLLKPETEAVIPSLLSIDPKAAAALRSLPTMVARQQLTRARVAAGFLGDEPAPDELATTAIALRGSQRAAPTRSPVPIALRVADRREKGRALLDLAEKDLRTGRAAVDLIDAASRSETLGLRNAIFSVATGGDRVEALRAQLKELAEDRSFSTLDRDATFIGMHERVSTNIDFLVTGHTHLARAIEREFGRAYYFNTGTWARVFRIDPDTLSKPDAFRSLFTSLSSNTIETLDREPGLIAVRPHLAAFWHDNAGVHGELRQVAAAAPYTVEPLQGTRYTRR